MNRKDILFRRRLMAREIRNSQAAYLFNNGAWLPTIESKSTYNSSSGYYDIGNNARISGGETINIWYYLNNITLEAGHSYLIDVQLVGYTQYWVNVPASNINIDFMMASTDGSRVAHIFYRGGNETVTDHMTNVFTDNTYSYNSLQRMTAISTTPFTMYTTIKKIS